MWGPSPIKYLWLWRAISPTLRWDTRRSNTTLNLARKLSNVGVKYGSFGYLKSCDIDDWEWNWVFWWVEKLGEKLLELDICRNRGFWEFKYLFASLGRLRISRGRNIMRNMRRWRISRNKNIMRKMGRLGILGNRNIMRKLGRLGVLGNRNVERWMRKLNFFMELHNPHNFHNHLKMDQNY